VALCSAVTTGKTGGFLFALILLQIGSIFVTVDLIRRHTLIDFILTNFINQKKINNEI